MLGMVSISPVSYTHLDVYKRQVFIVLWKDIAEILRHLFARFTWVLVVATIPAVVAGVLLLSLIHI